MVWNKRFLKVTRLLLNSFWKNVYSTFQLTIQYFFLDYFRVIKKKTFQISQIKKINTLINLHQACAKGGPQRYLFNNNKKIFNQSKNLKLYKANGKSKYII